MNFPPIEIDKFIEIKAALKQPTISILFPVHERQAYIQDSLESVLAQHGVVAEIIISDDASTDHSFQKVLETIGNFLLRVNCPHRIIVRKGISRLQRDHIHLMADFAQCDLLCQAHDDDISHPDRAKLTVDAFNLFPNMTMMAIECSYIDHNGNSLGEVKKINGSIPVNPINIEEVIAPANRHLVGACQAWKKSASAHFERLDSSYAAVTHDWIQAFRCALVGEVRLAASPLIKRRIHENSWTSSMTSSETHVSKSFGWHLHHLSSQLTIIKDLERAHQISLISEKRYKDVLNYITIARNKTLGLMMDDYQLLVQDNWNLLWRKSKSHAGL